MTDVRFPLGPTLAGAVWPEQSSTASRAARAVLLALVGSAVLTLSARLNIPFWPVPLTLQSLAVLLIAAGFGLWLGTATVALYLLEGAVGLPVFAGTPMHGLGIAYMMGPTGGYLAGFLAASALVGFFAERGADRSVPKLLGAMTLGHLVLFGFGYAWLAHLLGKDLAFTAGVEPFILGTVVKTLLAGLVVPAVWQLMAKRR